MRLFCNFNPETQFLVEISSREISRRKNLSYRQRILVEKPPMNRRIFSSNSLVITLIVSILTKCFKILTLLLFNSSKIIINSTRAINFTRHYINIFDSCFSCFEPLSSCLSKQLLYFWKEKKSNEVENSISLSKIIL